ncbi:hypothetical protein QQ045_030709 [Rhodiola kirilowii]
MKVRRRSHYSPSNLTFLSLTPAPIQSPLHLWTPLHSDADSLVDASSLRRRFSRLFTCRSFSCRCLFTPTPIQSRSTTWLLTPTPIQVAEGAPGMGSPRDADCFDLSSGPSVEAGSDDLSTVITILYNYRVLSRHAEAERFTEAEPDKKSVIITAKETERCEKRCEAAFQELILGVMCPIIKRTYVTNLGQLPKMQNGVVDVDDSGEEASITKSHYKTICSFTTMQI